MYVQYKYILALYKFNYGYYYLKLDAYLTTATIKLISKLLKPYETHI